MERLANQGQNAGPGDLAKDMQDVSASPSPTDPAENIPGNTVPDKADSGGISESGKGNGDGSDDDGQVIQFDKSLFVKGPVFRVASNQQNREIGFNYTGKTILEEVRWQVVVESKVETLGSSNFEFLKSSFFSLSSGDSFGGIFLLVSIGVRFSSFLLEIGILFNFSEYFGH